MPTIGLKTLKQSKIAGLKGIVIKSKQHVFLDKSKCIKFANKNNMFISVK
ncbi:MAG: UDP-2,3-diacylglucosamine diphosphatase LpxI domain-containing protein [Candidatus Pelagibacter sp.]